MVCSCLFKRAGEGPVLSGMSSSIEPSSRSSNALRLAICDLSPVGLRALGLWLGVRFKGPRKYKMCLTKLKQRSVEQKRAQLNV